MDKIQEIMGLVGAYGTAVEATCSSDGGCSESHAETRAYKSIESALRELVERKPLSLERIYEIEAVSNVPHTRTTYTKDCWGDDKKDTEEVRVFSFPLFARNIERAHGIGNESKGQ